MSLLFHKRSEVKSASRSEACRDWELSRQRIWQEQHGIVRLFCHPLTCFKRYAAA